MDQKQLFSFIQRIIETSPSQVAATQALEQLKTILEPQLSEEDKAQLSIALSGAADDFRDLCSQVQGLELDAMKLKIAAERAHQRRVQREADERNGRC